MIWIGRWLCRHGWHSIHEGNCLRCDHRWHRPSVAKNQEGR